MLTRLSLTLFDLKILMKSWSVIFISETFFFLLEGSTACRRRIANSEFGAKPSEIRGLMISYASRTPEPSSSQAMNKF